MEKELKDNKFVSIWYDRFTEYDTSHSPYGFEIIMLCDGEEPATFRKNEKGAEKFIEHINKLSNMHPPPDGIILIQTNTHKAGSEQAELDRKEIRISETKQPKKKATYKKSGLGNFDPEVLKQEIRQEMETTIKIESLQKDVLSKTTQIAELTKRLDEANKQIDEFESKDYEAEEAAKKEANLKLYLSAGGKILSQMENVPFLQKIGVGLAGLMTSEASDEPEGLASNKSEKDQAYDSFVGFLKSLTEEEFQKFGIIVKEIMQDHAKIDLIIKNGLGINDIGEYIKNL